MERIDGGMPKQSRTWPPSPHEPDTPPAHLPLIRDIVAIRSSECRELSLTKMRLSPSVSWALAYCAQQLSVIAAVVLTSAPIEGLAIYDGSAIARNLPSLSAIPLAFWLGRRERLHSSGVWLWLPWTLAALNDATLFGWKFVYRAYVFRPEGFEILVASSTISTILYSTTLICLMRWVKGAQRAKLEQQ